MKKYLPGIAPLIILIAVGIIIAGAGGTYVVRKQFVKTHPDKKAELDVDKIQKQVENPQELPDPSPEPSPELSIGPYTHKPATSPKDEALDDAGQSSAEPGFTINPPAGWGKSNLGSGITFMSPDKDKENLTPPLFHEQPANIQIIIDYLENYDKLKEEQNYTQDKLLETIVNVDIKNLYTSYNPTYLTEQKTTFAGQDAYIVEMKAKLETGVWEHVYSYVLIKNKHAVLVSGHALDSAWTKRQGIIKASLNTFSFTN